jgi:hypothetical protein
MNSILDIPLKMPLPSDGQYFMDKTTDQVIHGVKTFTDGVKIQLVDSTPGIPIVDADGVFALYGGDGTRHFAIFPDLDGDGDYDADIWSKNNMYLVADGSVHIRSSLTSGTYEGRVVFKALNNANYIQSARNYSNTTHNDLVISDYNDSDAWVHFDQSRAGYATFGAKLSSGAYPDALARLNAIDGANTVATISSTNVSGLARLSFYASTTTGTDTVAVGATGNDAFIRAGGAIKLTVKSTGEIVVAGGVISGVTDPTSAQHAATKNYVDVADALSLHLSGTETITGNKTMTGTLLMDGVTITAGTATDTFKEALIVRRNNVSRGRIDNNGNGMRVQALTNTLYVRGSSDVGMTIAAAAAAWESGITSISYPNGLNEYLYNTSDQTTNYERLHTYWNSNVLTMITESGGTGTTRAMAITGGNTTFNLSSSSNITRGTTAVAGPIFAVGSTFNASAISQNAFAVNPTINQTGTAGYIAHLVNATETATGSGTKLLMDLQTNSVSQFRVYNTGLMQIANVGSAPSGTPSASGYMYVEAGALKYKGSSGTVTVLAPA